MEAVRIGIVGLGRMGRFHLAALTATDAVEVVAVAEPSADSLRAAAEHLNDVAAYPTAEEVFAHDGVDGVLIASPTPTHPGLVRQALDAQLHVLCEKPLSLDPAVSMELESRRGGRVLQVGFWRRFSPPWRAARHAVVDEGRIGRPLLVRLSQWDADPPPPQFCDPAVSGGLAIDCGVHEYDLAEWFTGERVERVHAWNLPVVDENLAAAGDVDNLVAALEMTGDVVATVDLSRNARYDDDVRTEILGAEGAVLIDLLPTGRARIGDGSGMHELAGSQAADATKAGVIGQAEAFAHAIRNGGSDLPNAADSARATQIGLAVQEAARTGEAVSV